MQAERTFPSLKILNKKTSKKRITAVVVLLSILVISGVFWWLRYEGITMADQAFCGMDEHTHTAECRANSCTLTEHTHTAACYSNDSADVENAAIWEKTINKKAFTGDVAKDMVTIATSQLGYNESSRNFDIDDSGTRCGYTRYGEWYGNKYGHWSAMFVSFCLNYANVTDDSALINSGSAAMLTAWQNAGLTTEYPVAGDIVFIDAKGKGSCTDVGVVISVGNDISVIQGNSNDKVEKLTYSADDDKILGYGSVYFALEQTLTEKETSRVEYVRNLASKVPTEDEVIEKMIELGSGAEFNAWRKELVQQIKIAYYYYDLLPAKLEPLVYNANRILDLNYLWQSDVLDGEEESTGTSELVIPVHQINVYETFNEFAYPEAYSTISTGQVSESTGARYPWWHAYVIEKHEDGYFYVADIDRVLGEDNDKVEMVAQTEEGFVYLIWNDHPLEDQSESIEIGNIVKVNPESMLETEKAGTQMPLGELTFILGSAPETYVKKSTFALGDENIALGKNYHTSLLYDLSYAANPTGSGIVYPDEGGITLTDGVTSESGFHPVDWMGFHTRCPDYMKTGYFETIVDLGEEYDVGKVTLYCAVNAEWGIAAPGTVIFYGSTDGNTYDPIGTVVPTADGSKYCVEVSLRCNVKARYIKAEITPNAADWVFVSEFEAYEIFQAPAIIESADTSELIKINLYDYLNNINNPYYYTYTDDDGVSQTLFNQFYPGFSQGGGSRYVHPSFNINQLNYGDNIHTNRESGEYGVTSNANSDRENTGKINQTNADSPANLPIEDAMWPKLYHNYPAALDENGNPLSLAYLFDENLYDLDGDGTVLGPDVYAHKQNTDNINGLFQYDEATGTYHFDSRQNFAQFNKKENEFVLYEQNISPNFIMYPFGNFLPFNNIETQATQMSQIDRDWFIQIAKNALYRSNLIEASKGSGTVFSWDGLSFHDNIFISGEPNESNISNLGFASFPIDYCNPDTDSVSISEKCWIITEDITATTPASYSSWATAVLLQPSEIDGVYEVVDRKVGTGNTESVTFSVEPTDGMIVLMAHTAYSNDKDLFATQRADELASFTAGQKVRFVGIDIADSEVTTSGTTQYFYTAPGTSDLVIPEPGTYAVNINELCPNDYLTMVFAIRNMIKNADAEYGKTWTYTELVAKYFESIDENVFANFIYPEEDADKIFCIDYDEQKNFFFGMDMTFEFIQPKDGLTGPNGDAPMLYRFSGDDDVWVYLDDILFLDLSGIHRHVGGTIDFTNGIVTYNELMPETGDVDYDVAKKTVTFKEILRNAGYTETQIKQALSDKGGFADYTEHTFKFYYMERGSGSGVCRMDFNVPLIESNRIMVGKQVDDGEVEALGNPDYYFQILHADDESTPYFDEGTKFTVISDANPIGESAEVGYNGIFTLKAGQVAVFSALANEGDYVVRELFAEDVYEQYGEVNITVNGVPANSGQYKNVTDTVEINGNLNDTAWRDSDWIYVSSKDDGRYQPDDYSGAYISDFRYQVRVDDKKAYFAVEYFNSPTASTDDGNTGTKIRIWTHDSESELTNYTGFYDVYLNESSETVYTGWRNVGTSAAHQKEQIANSTMEAASQFVGDSWIVEFSVDLAEVGGTNGEFKFFFNMMDMVPVTITTETTDEETSETTTTTTTKNIPKILLYPANSDTDFPYNTFVTAKALDSTDPYFAMGTHPELNSDAFEYENITIGNANYKYVQSTPIDISDGYATVEFTNVIDESKLGRFAIEKELTDEITNNYNVEFTLNVTLDGEPIPVGTSYLYIAPDGTKAVIPVTTEGEVTIKHGYRILFENLLVGTVYTVVEVGAAEMGYDVHYHHGNLEDEAEMTDNNEAMGTIHDYSSTCTLIVHNVKDGVKVVVNGEKTLGNTNGMDNEYVFTLTQVDKDLNPIAGGTVMTSSVTIAEGTQPFNFVLSYPAGVTQAGTYYYLIEESGANALTGMDTTRYLLTVVVTTNGTNEIEATHTLVKVGFEDETVDKASFYNNIYQSLTINKEILGFYNGGAFEFTINAIYNGEMVIGNYPCIYPDGTQGTLEFVYGGNATVHLNDNQSITVYLPYNTYWKVIEVQVAGCDTQVGLAEDRLNAGNTLTGFLTEDRTAYFVNIFGTELPSTGSNMRLIITYCGIGLMAVAFIGACVFRISRKRRNRK